jgi:hypothetical protein
MKSRGKTPPDVIPGAARLQSAGGLEAVRRVKTLIAAGAIAGTLGGWGLIAQQNVNANTNTPPPEQTATPQPTATSAVDTATATAMAIVQATPAPVKLSPAQLQRPPSS